jgi:CRISPR-associated endonuclease/helicase Cas3
MDTKFTEMMTFKAKKQEANQPAQGLVEHCFGVGVLSYYIAKSLLGNNEPLPLSDFYRSGCGHDVGKIDLLTQNYYNNMPPSDDDYYFHTETGYAILSSLLGKDDIASYVSYWHHAKRWRDIEPNCESIITMSEYGEDLLPNANTFFEAIRSMQESYNDEVQSIDFIKGNTDAHPENIGMPMFKAYPSLPIDPEKVKLGAVLNNSFNEVVKNAKSNARRSIVRSVVVSADRIISALKPEELTRFIEDKKIHELVSQAFLSDPANEMIAHVERCMENFLERYGNNERNSKQTQAAIALQNIKNGVAVLQGPAGVGKTKIALDWLAQAHKNSPVKKAIWICPRKQVCDGVFDELISEEYISGARVEIITGDRAMININGVLQETTEDNEFSGDIIVTTIDQIASTIVTHKDIERLMLVMQSHLIVDEFHELQSTKGLLLMLAELVQIARLVSAKNETLSPRLVLVSATINPVMTQRLLDVDCVSNNGHIVKIQSFNKSDYEIHLDDLDINPPTSNPLTTIYQQKAIVIFNTATAAFKTYLENVAHEKSILFHSRFKLADKTKLMQGIMSAFGKNPSADASVVLRSGPIVQASLNISASFLVSQSSSPESLTQRLGRDNRFGFDKKATFVIAHSPKDMSSKTALDAGFELNRTVAFIDFLKSKSISGSTIKISDWYDIYDEFYAVALSGDNDIALACKKDLYAAVFAGIGIMKEDAFAPRNIEDTKTDGAVRLKRNSMRGGTSYYVMMIEYVDDTRSHYIEDPIVVDLQTLNRYSNETSPLDYFEQNHVEIVTKDKSHFGKSARSIISTGRSNRKNMKFKAVSAEFPIYASYESQHLLLAKSQPKPAQELVYWIKDGTPLGYFPKNN